MRVDRSTVMGIGCLTVVSNGYYRLCPPFRSGGSLIVSQDCLGRLRRHFFILWYEPRVVGCTASSTRTTCSFIEVLR